ncbi:MAG: hypothetical protein CM1200mP12_18470 [Gammaproteobacteria bacterium]|nr:MAG: hypothetical protein CM1200mP12_18470 [Gammaproteobacteria bacterium]
MTKDMVLETRKTKKDQFPEDFFKSGKAYRLGLIAESKSLPFGISKGS